MNGLAGKERQSTSKRRISLYLAMSARLVIRKSLLAYFNWIEKVKEKLKILNSHESLATRMKREKKSQPLQPQATKTSLIRLTRWIEKRRKEQRPRKRAKKKRINCRQYWKSKSRPIDLMSDPIEVKKDRNQKNIISQPALQIDD